MKKLSILLSLSVIMLASACKKDKKDDSTPTPAAPTPTNITVELCMVEYTSYPGTATGPNIVAVSPAGDTISIQAMNVMATYADYMAVPDGCAVPLSCTVTYPMLDNGSHYTVYLKEGLTVMGSIGVEYGSVISLSGVGYSIMCGTNYHRVVVGW